MITVKTRFFGHLRGLAGIKEETVQLAEGAHLADLLQRLADSHAPDFKDHLLTEEGEVKPFVRVLIAGREAGLVGGLKAPLQDGDEVAFLPATAGGTQTGRGSRFGEVIFEPQRRLFWPGVVVLVNGRPLHQRGWKLP
ncbi:MAG: ubiquitin-like small modifier protein 1 [Anaerolineae bacterium]